MTSVRQFEVADYVVFFGLLAVPVCIGIYYAFVDRKKNSVDKYYFGERKMATIPVGLSMGVSFISAITLLGFPAHTYVYGTITFWFGIALMLPLIFAWIYYIPLMHRLHVSSVYEYLEARFHRSARLVASILIIVKTLIYMGTSLYLTSLALDAVTSIGIEVSVVVSAVACTIYTTLGGMKAVVWTDVIQSSIMITGIFALLIRTTLLVGGFGKVAEAIERGNRNNFLSFNFDITMHHTISAIVLGEGLSWIGVMCINQTMVQRYLSCKNAKSARRASIIAAAIMMTMIIASVYNGCAMYAYYEGCDPKLDGKVKKVDQTVPYLVLEIFSGAPGMAGLFVSAAYSGLLSTLSSGINALSALVLQDFVLLCKPKLNENVRLSISKITCLCFGAISLGMAFFAKYAAVTVIQFSSAMVGTFKGPVLGLFVLGIHFPWTNAIGALCGCLTGIAFTLWLSIGSVVNGSKLDSQKLPLSSALCNSSSYDSIFDVNNSMTTISNGFQTWDATDNMGNIQTSVAEASSSVYTISYFFYAPLGLLVTVTVGLLVSVLTGRNNPKNMDPKLFVPFFDNKYLPKRVRKFFRFGVPEHRAEGGHESEEKFDLLDDLNPETKAVNLSK